MSIKCIPTLLSRSSPLDILLASSRAKNHLITHQPPKSPRDAIAAAVHRTIDPPLVRRNGHCQTKSVEHSLFNTSSWTTQVSFDLKYRNSAEFCLKAQISVLTFFSVSIHIFPVGYGAISHNDINGQWKQAIGNSGGEVCTDQATISAISASAGDNCDDSSTSIQQCHALGTPQQLHNEHNINNITIIGRENGAAVDVLHSSARSGKSSAGNNNRRGKRKLETSGDSNAGQSGKHHCCSSSPPSPLSFTSETNNRTIASTNHSDHNNHENKALLEIENSIKLLKSAQKRLSESESYMKSSMDKKLTWMNELRGIIGKLECLETKVPQQCQITTRSSSGQQENDKECELSNGKRKKVNIMTLLPTHSSINSHNYYL